jgi:putative endonuclease
MYMIRFKQKITKTKCKNSSTSIFLQTTITQLYIIGVTSNIIKRIWKHKNKVVKGFTQKYNINKLVYFETVNDAESAILREKFLKHKTRQFKIDLVESMNPNWQDLYASLL